MNISTKVTFHFIKVFKGYQSSPGFPSGPPDMKKAREEQARHFEVNEILVTFDRKKSAHSATVFGPDQKPWNWERRYVHSKKSRVVIGPDGNPGEL